MPSEVYKPANKTIVTEIKGFVTDAVRRVSAFRSTTAVKVALETPVTTQDVNVGNSGFVIQNVTSVIGISSIKPFDIELAQTTQETTYPPITYDVSFAGSSSVLHPDGDLLISVTDADLFDTSVDVTVTNVTTGEVETVTLTQVGSSSTYVGTIHTINLPGQGPAGDGELMAQVDDMIQVNYVNATDSAGDPENVNYFITVTAVPTHTAIVKLDDAFTLGSTLKVSMYDPDVAGAGTASLTLTNLRSNQVETLTLVETTPGLFVVDFPTVDDITVLPDESGVMNAVSGDSLLAHYQDLINDVGDPEAIDVAIVVGVTTTYTGVISHAGTDKAGDTLTIRVTDPDRDTSLQVTVVNQSTNETETLTLLETHPLSGVFELELPTVLGEDVWYAGTNNDGSMRVKPDDIVRVTYNDPVAVTGLPFAIIHDITVLAPDPAPTPPDPIITDVINTVKMTVNGLFYIHGNMPNTILTIKKTTSETDDVIRCTLLVV